MQKNIMKLFSKILLLFCLANVAMGAVNLRAENSEELSQRIVKDAKAKGVDLGAQLNAAYDAALSVRKRVTDKAEDHEDGWLGVAIELSKADSLEGFLGEDTANDVESINTIASTALNEGRRLFRYDFVPPPDINPGRVILRYISFVAAWVALFGAWYGFG